MTDDNGRTVSDGVTTAGNGSLPELSRRFVLRGAAGAGIAGLAATALVSGSVSQALAASASRDGADAAAPAPGAGQSDLVVHVRDARTGEMDIFSGTSQARITDPTLAARLTRAIR